MCCNLTTVAVQRMGCKNVLCGCSTNVYRQLQCCSRMLTLIFAGQHSIRKSVDVSFLGACCLILLRKRMNSTHSICRSLSGKVCSDFCLSSVSSPHIYNYIIIVGNVCSEFCLSSVFNNSFILRRPISCPGRATLPIC